MTVVNSPLAKLRVPVKTLDRIAPQSNGPGELRCEPAAPKLFAAAMAAAQQRCDAVDGALMVCGVRVMLGVKPRDRLDGLLYVDWKDRGSRVRFRHLLSSVAEITQQIRSRTMRVVAVARENTQQTY